MRQISTCFNLKSIWMGTKRNVICVSIALAMMPLAGCDQHPADWGQGPTKVVTAASITTQPTNIATPVGRAATFTVTAAGTAPLTYQWSKNGVAIEGATSASYSTPTVALTDDGTTYQVTVSNSAGSATSNTVTLTAGPRAPAIGDLRYLLLQQVMTSGLKYGINTNFNPGMTVHFPDEVGSPLMLGSSDDCNPGEDFGCTWFYQTFTTPAGVPGLTMYYSSGAYISMISDLQSIPASSSVIISFDPQPGNKVYGVAWVQTAQTGGFDYQMETVPPSQLAATVAADGATSRVVTAIGLDTNTGMADVISYGWQSDTTTIYESTAQIVSPQNIASVAMAMAAQGYFISAFGGNDTMGYAIVGMRVKGDTMQRFAESSINGVMTYAGSQDSAYYTTPIYFVEPGNQVLIAEQ